MVTRRNTRQRALVLEAVRSRCDHPTADQVYAQVHETDPHVSLATVYRNLHTLAEEGEILSVPAPGEEHFDLRCDDHAHLVCRQCGRVVDVPGQLDALMSDSDLDKRAARQTGWRVNGHSLIFEGLCPDCQARGEV